MSTKYPIGIQNFEKLRKDRMKFGNYWFKNSMPDYLVELLKLSHYDLHHITNIETDTDALNSVDSSSTNPIPIIYQNGYLTIKDYDRKFCLYRLGFPNQEVEEGFIKHLLPFASDPRKLFKHTTLTYSV